MGPNDTIVVYECVIEHASIVPIILAMLATPIHIMMLKILIQRLKLKYPRHIILLSLSISDNIQLIITALLHVFSILLHLRTDSQACQITRKILETVVVVTFYASTGSILGLSFERYVACVHCFRVHELVTDKLVKRLLLGVWAFGLVMAFGDPESYKSNLTQYVLHQSITRRYMYTITVIVTTIILLYVQIRLYLLSHKKIFRVIKVHPVGSFTERAEAVSTRKRQWKLSIVASAVVAMFVISMCPVTIYNIISGFRDTQEYSRVKPILLLIAMLNTLANPFVYGLGMTDTREAIKEELIAIKNWIPFLRSRSEDQ